MDGKGLFSRAARMAVLLSASYEIAHAQAIRATRTSSLIASRVDQSIRIDGKLDEPLWGLVRPAGRFTQAEPSAGDAPTKPTDVRVVFTDDAVVIGARLEDDSHVLQEAASLKDAVADGHLPDYFEVQIDPHPDHRTRFEFVVTARGDTRSGLLTVGGAAIDSWKINWDVATRVDEHGWSIEMRIPLSEMHAEKGSETWGIGFQRFSWTRMETDVLDGRKPARVAEK